MEVVLSEKEKWIVVTVKGRVDSFNQQIVEQKLKTLSKAGQKWIALDLQNVPYLSLSAAWSIARLELYIKNQAGDLAFISQSQYLKKLFHTLCNKDLKPNLDSL